MEAHDSIANVPFYRNKRTGVVRWDIPLDVRTYLSADSEAKVGGFRHRQTDRYTHRHTDKQTNTMTDRHTHTHTQRQTETRTDRQTDTHTDMQTNRQTEGGISSNPVGSHYRIKLFSRKMRFLSLFYYYINFLLYLYIRFKY